MNRSRPSSRQGSPSLRSAIATAAMLVSAALPLCAAEHITLRNGFELDCTARDLVDGRVRLYLGSGATDYLEVAPDFILSAEPLPAADLASASNAASTLAMALPVSAAGAQTASVGTRTPFDAALHGTDVHALVQHAGRTHNIDADLLSSIIRAESGGNVHAVSRTGARGLMQLMPATATAMGVADSFVPEQNVAGGAAYLDRLLTLYHDDIVLAVAAYNAGPGAVARFHGVPPYRETRAYVARVVNEFNRRKLAAR